MTDDLIRRQDAIMVVKDQRLKAIGCIPESYNAGVDASASVLEMIPSARKWIPCSIKLPKKTDLYYVTIRDEDGTEYTSCMCYYINLARWEVDVNVIAWMPAPEPYRG